MIRTQVEYDRFQNIDFRLLGSVGVGVNLARGDDLNWRFEMGPAYESVRFREVVVGQDRSEESFGMYFKTTTDWEITRDLEFELSAISYVSIENSDDATHLVRGTLSLDIARDFTLDLTLQWNRNENPEREDDGRLPDRDDFRFLIGLGWEF